MAQSKSDVDLETLKPLSKAEQELIVCCKTGLPLDLGMTVPDQATDENSIRGPLIRHLLLGGCKEAPAHAKGVRVFGAFITQALDFEYGETDQALGLHHCKIAEDLDFDDCRIRSIFLSGSEIAGLSAERAKIERNIFMRTKFHAKGPVGLSGAKIGGQLACSDGQFDLGLDGNGLVVKAGVFLSDGFHAKEVVDLGSAEIGGQLACDGGQFDQGLNGNALVVKADVFLRDGFHAKGPVILRGAEIGGQLACDGGQFDQGLNGNALVVKADVFLRDEFHAKGPVDLIRAEIGGQLNCSDGQFDQGLELQNAIIASAFLWQNVKCTEMLDLNQTSVGVLSDELSSWRGELKAHINGFTYQSIESPELGAQERID